MAIGFSCCAITEELHRQEKKWFLIIPIIPKKQKWRQACSHPHEWFRSSSSNQKKQQPVQSAAADLCRAGWNGECGGRWSADPTALCPGTAASWWCNSLALPPPLADRRDIPLWRAGASWVQGESWSWRNTDD